MTLKSYLQKQLSINSKEAELIESVYREFRGNSSTFKEGFQQVYTNINKFFSQAGKYDIHIISDYSYTIATTLTDMVLWDYFMSALNLGFKKGKDTFNLSLQDEDGVISAEVQNNKLIVTTENNCRVTFTEKSRSKDIQGSFRTDPKYIS